MATRVRVVSNLGEGQKRTKSGWTITQGLKITEKKVLPLQLYILIWFDFQVFSDKDYKLEVPSHKYLPCVQVQCGTLQELTQYSRGVGHEVPGVMAALCECNLHVHV